MMRIKTISALTAVSIVMSFSLPALANAVGNGQVENDIDVSLDLACNNSGSEVTLGASKRNEKTTNLKVTMAFANPSVTRSADGTEWIKKSGKSTIIKVTDGSDLTTIPLEITSRGLKKGSTHRGMGNPYINYLDGSTWKTDLGRCESPGQALKSIKLREAQLNFDGAVSGERKGPCLTNSKQSSMGFKGKFNPRNVNFSAGTQMIYSNKPVVVEVRTEGEITYFDVESPNGRHLGTFTGNGEFEVFDVAGYHVTRQSLAVGIGDWDADNSFDLPEKTGVGIGGNPNVWLKAGDGSFTLLGRCNDLK